MSDSTDVDRAEMTKLWGMLDLITPMALRVAGTLRVADHIREGRDRLPDLASRSGAHAGALRRLMRYLVVRGVFTEPEPDRFGLTRLSELMTDNHPAGSRRWMDLEGFGGRMDLSFMQLLQAVRTGSAAEGWKDYLDDEAISASFDSMMEAQSRRQAPAIAAAYDWQRVCHVVDAGGGTGTLLIELLERNPRLRGTLIERPPTAERAREAIAGAALAQRCVVVAGDLFAVDMPAADVYLFKFVWHAFADEDVVRVLRRCIDAGPPEGRVIVVEHTAAPGEDRTEFTAMDLRMLVLGQGRERTVEEYAALGRRLGLELGAVVAADAGVHLMEMRRAGQRR